MDNLTLPPELDSALWQYHAALEPDAGFAARLELELRSRHPAFSPTPSAVFPRRTFMQTLRARPALAILLVLLSLALLTGVAYAIGKLAGFIPGFGFTDDASTVYLLKEPAQAGHDGVTIRVENAVSDGEKFWVSLSLSGENESVRPWHAGAMVVLPDGIQIQSQSGQEDEPNAFPRKASYEFPALPVGIDTLTLRYEFFTRDGTAEWTVDIPLQLRPIRADELVPARETSAASLQSETHGGLTLVLDNVAPASDKTILQVSLRFDQPGTSLNTDWGVTLSDDNGKIYPLTEVLSDSNNQSKTYETLPFHGGENLTLSLTAFPDAENLPLSIDFPPATFTFDPGTHPQPGQHWELDEHIQAGGYQIHAIGVKQVSPTELLFEFAPTSGVTGVMLYSPLASGGTGGAPVENANFTAGMRFEEMPEQPIAVSITRVYYTAHGKWQIRWQAPPAPEGVQVGPTNTPPPAAAAFPTPTALAPSDNPLLLEVQALAQKFDVSLRQGPGWIHLLAAHENRQKAGQTFPPSVYTTEQWLELNAEGYVIRSLWTDRDQAGNIIQQSVSIGNYFSNFTTGESGYNEYARYLFSTDMLTQDLIQAAEYHSRFTRLEVACDDGSPCLLVTLFDEFAQSGEAQGITGMGRRTWIRLDTGQQVKVQAFSRLEDGSEQVEHTQVNMIVEKVDKPPQDVLQIISGVIVP